MRRFVSSASLVLVSGMLLSGCSGFDTFFSDSHSITWNPNRPIGDGENMRRVKGIDPSLEPLKPEEGNVWPGPAAPEPTLQDLERQQNEAGQNPSATVPTPFAPDHQQPRPYIPGATPYPSATPPSTVPGAGPQGPIYQTPSGPAVGTRGQGGLTTINPPGNNGSIVVPNGNGTSTVISPDGSISTVPTPK